MTKIPTQSTWPGAPGSSPFRTPGRCAGSPRWRFPGPSCLQSQSVSSPYTWGPPGWILARNTTTCCWTEGRKKKQGKMSPDIMKNHHAAKWCRRDALYMQLMKARTWPHGEAIPFMERSSRPPRVRITSAPNDSLVSIMWSRLNQDSAYFPAGSASSPRKGISPSPRCSWPPASGCVPPGWTRWRGWRCPPPRPTSRRSPSVSSSSPERWRKIYGKRYVT